MDLREAERVLALAIETRPELDAGGLRPATDELAANPTLIPDAAECFAAADDSRKLLGLLGALSIFWQDTGGIDKGRQLTEHYLSGAEYGATPELARAQLVVGELAFRQGDQEGATTATTDAQRTGTEVDDQWVVARAELNLARIAFRDGDAERIKAHAERVAQLAGDDQALACGAVHMLGWGEYTAGDVDAALVLFEQNALSYRELGRGVNESGEWSNLADLAAEKGDIEKARAYLLQALQIPAAARSNYLLPSLLRTAGVLAAVAGKPEVAIELVGAAESQYESAGLVPDPGDDFSEDAIAKAEGQLGRSRCDALKALGKDLSSEQALRLAQQSLAD